MQITGLTSEKQYDYNLSVSVFLFLSVCLCLSVSLCVSVCVSLCMSVCLSVTHTHARTHARTYARTHARMHARTHIHKPDQATTRRIKFHPRNHPLRLEEANQHSRASENSKGTPVTLHHANPWSSARQEWPLVGGPWVWGGQEWPLVGGTLALARTRGLCERSVPSVGKLPANTSRVVVSEGKPLLCWVTVWPLGLVCPALSKTKTKCACITFVLWGMDI